MRLVASLFDGTGINKSYIFVTISSAIYKFCMKLKYLTVTFCNKQFHAFFTILFCALLLK